MDYNLDYLEGMLRMYSHTSEQINRIRWDFVKDAKPKIVLDYGSGVGWFRAFRPKGVEVDTFDIGEFPQTGINHEGYDLITYWDVIEHFESPQDEIYKDTKYIAMTTPILPKRKNLKDWKHYKPGEHNHYFTRQELNSLFEEIGFKLIKEGTPECPPRTDVHSFLYENSFY